MVATKCPNCGYKIHCMSCDDYECSGCGADLVVWYRMNATERKNYEKFKGWDNAKL